MSHSVDERYAVYAENPSKARKAHECDACDEPIRPGDTYTRVRWIFDGTADGVKRCARCQFLHEFLRSHGDSDMWPAERLDCGEEYEEHWGHEPAPYIAALAFWRQGDPLPAIYPCSQWERRWLQQTACFSYWRNSGHEQCSKRAIPNNHSHVSACTEAS